MNSIESLPLFDMDIVAEALKSTNKDIQRLYAPFKPRGAPPNFNNGSIDPSNAIAMHSFLGGRGRDGRDGADRTASPSGIVLSQSLNLLGDKGMDEEVEKELILSASRREGDNSGASSRQISIDTSSIDWSPPETPHHQSRRNTIFSEYLSILSQHLFPTDRG